MRLYLVLLLIFLLALLQGAVLPLNLVLLVVLVWAAIKPPRESLIVAFFSGIFLDLAHGSPLGFSSFVLLVACYVLHIYSRRFDPTHHLFLPILVFLSANLYSLISSHSFNWFEGAILAALALMSRPVVKFYQEEVSQDKLKI